MPFDEYGNGYGEHEGLHDLVHRVPIKTSPFVDTGYAKVNAHLDDVEIERIAEAVVRLLQEMSKDE